MAVIPSSPTAVDYVKARSLDGSVWSFLVTETDEHGRIIHQTDEIGTHGEVLDAAARFVSASFLPTDSDSGRFVTWLREQGRPYATMIRWAHVWSSGATVSVVIVRG